MCRFIARALGWCSSYESLWGHKLIQESHTRPWNRQKDSQRGRRPARGIFHLYHETWILLSAMNSPFGEEPGRWGLLRVFAPLMYSSLWSLIKAKNSGENSCYSWYGFANLRNSSRIMKVFILLVKRQVEILKSKVLSRPSSFSLNKNSIQMLYSKSFDLRFFVCFKT